MFVSESLIERVKRKRRLGVAIGWLTEQNQPHDIKQIEEAFQRFNLSSPDEDFLIRLFIHRRSD